MMKRILGAALALALFLIPLASQAKTFKNTLPRKDWTKYGVNPWRLDTDNDGYPDAWEVKNGYCPTSQESLAIGDSNCEKGTIDFKKETYKAPAAIADLAAREVKTFGSCTELKNTLAASYDDYHGAYLKTFGERGGGDGEQKDAPREEGTTGAPFSAFDLGIDTKAVSGLSGPSDSTTNVQVEGVDEGDIIETDGKYIYTLEYNKVNVTKAVPVTAAVVVAEIDASDVGSARELYLENNVLTVVGSRYGVLSADVSGEEKIAANYAMYGYPYTVVQLWSVKNPSNPTLVRQLEFQGSLLSSRLKDGYWYGVMNHNISYSYWSEAKTATNESVVPLYRDQSGKSLDKTGGYKPLAGCANISYVTPVHESTYAEIVAVPVNKTAGSIGSKVIFGAGSNVYMSQKNLYLFSNRYNWFWGDVVPTSAAMNNTEIYKFGLDKTKITFKASQSVPGSILNQFSADEATGKEDVLRVVTTESKNVEPYVSNNLYTFDTDLNRIGWWEGFGGGEMVYAARFMGNRAYVVTYKNTDPLFVFDLTNPRAPKKLGELHISGYSNYLHPYDETHIIGIGKDAEVDESGNFALYQGMKMALFDVKDPNNPVQMFSTSIGDRGTDSYALYDHHAFLFSKQKNLLAIPVSVSQLSEEQKASTTTPSWSYGTPTYNGLYVYKLDLKNGFQFVGGVTHESASTLYPYMYSNSSIKRSLYIGNYLYAYSPQEISIHKLSDLTTVKEVTLQEPASEIGTVRTILMGL